MAWMTGGGPDGSPPLLNPAPQVNSMLAPPHGDHHLTFTIGSNHELHRGGMAGAGCVFASKHRRPTKQHHMKRPRQPLCRVGGSGGSPLTTSGVSTVGNHGVTAHWTPPQAAAAPPSSSSSVPPLSIPPQHLQVMPPPPPSSSTGHAAIYGASQPSHSSSQHHHRHHHHHPGPPQPPPSAFSYSSAGAITSSQLAHMVQVTHQALQAQPTHQQQTQQQQPPFVVGPTSRTFFTPSPVAAPPSAGHMHHHHHPHAAPPPRQQAPPFASPACPPPLGFALPPSQHAHHHSSTYNAAPSPPLALTATPQGYRLSMAAASSSSAPPHASSGTGTGFLFSSLSGASSQGVANSSSSSSTGAPAAVSAPPLTKPNFPSSFFAASSSSSAAASCTSFDCDPSGPRYRWECQVLGPTTRTGTFGSTGAQDGDGDDGDAEWVAYDEHIGAQLEMAHKEGRATVRFATRGFLYEVDLTRFTQTNTETGKCRPVRRITDVQVKFVDDIGSLVAWPFADKGAGRLVLYKEPERKMLDFTATMERLRRDGHERDVSFWEPSHLACQIKARHGEAAVVRVGFGTPEYLAVQEKFALVEGLDASSGHRVMAKHAGLANSILSIFRLQNPAQMERYCLLRSSISNNLVKAGRNGTEQVLWHGPSSLQAMEGIVLRGFDRMFANKGANAYGKGCYFARDLTIADRYACTVHSEVDGRTCQAVILAKVLVGEYTLGVKDMYPPPMKPGSTDVYDSTVNNVENPSIFVTYQDHQAIPYYLVTYSSPFQKQQN